MLFSTVLISLLATSASFVFASPIPSLDSEDALVARGFADSDLTELPFEKRSIDGEVDEIFERGLGDEELDLYVRDLEAESEQELLARGFDEGADADLERRSFKSFFKKIGKGLKKVASFVMKRDVEAEPELERRSFKSFFKKIGKGLKKVASFVMRRDDATSTELNRRDVTPESEIELMERDEPEAELELFERDFDDSELYERDEFEPELEIFERDFEPESEMELFERARD